MAFLGGVTVGVVVAIFAFRLFFRDRDDFAKCVEYSLTPDLLSWWRGRLGKDMTYSFRLTFYFLASVGAGMATYFELRRILGR